MFSKIKFVYSMSQNLIFSFYFIHINTFTINDNDTEDFNKLLINFQFSHRYSKK